jgi:hypothetical protein
MTFMSWMLQFEISMAILPENLGKQALGGNARKMWRIWTNGTKLVR